MAPVTMPYPFRTLALPISQPFGEFFVTSLPARVLLDVAYSDRLKATKQPDGSYDLDGSQRNIDEKRLKEIGQFINTPGETAFPNSIILAANYQESSGLIEEDEERKWKLLAGPDESVGVLEIPTDAKLAAIIDGQHRLFGFKYASSNNLEIPLLCSVFFDLPKPYQAFLFATVNANQRPVNKSLTYELFGYNIQDERPEKWTPEKFAVFLTRKLGTDKASPFFDHVTVAAENDFAPRMAEVRRERGWAVSTATVVEGILRLITRKPKRDAAEMGGISNYAGRDRSVLASLSDPSPLRTLFISNSDDVFYNGVKNYFLAVDKTLWSKAKPQSYIRKTVGIQALFDIARKIMGDAAKEKNFRQARFENILEPAGLIDFEDSFFQTSGTGRQRLRNCLELSLNLQTWDKIDKDVDEYKRLLQGLN
jgi:DNA phosphorothioation-associated DGQHR protein 1